MSQTVQLRLEELKNLGGECARTLHWFKAIADDGIFRLSGHGIDARNLHAVYAAAADFFAQDLEDKQRLEVLSAKGQRGYASFGREKSRSGAPDLKEFFQMGLPDRSHADAVHQAYGPNLWPESIPSLRTACEKLFEELSRVSHVLLEFFSQGVYGVPKKLAELAREGDWAMRIVHCPLIANDMPEDGQRTAEHTDFGLFTLLPASTAPGFEWRDQSGHWHGVESTPESLLVNIGDLLTQLSEGKLKPCVHRVHRDTAPQSSRLSVAFYVHPRREVELQGMTAGATLEKRLNEAGLVGS